MAGRSIEFLNGEDASYVAFYGDRWWEFNEQEQADARLVFELNLLRSERRKKLTENARKEAEYWEDDSMYFEILNQELGINGWPKR